MDYKIILLCVIAGFSWLYLIANHFRYARQSAKIDYNALASYRLDRLVDDADDDANPTNEMSVSSS